MKRTGRTIGYGWVLALSIAAVSGCGGQPQEGQRSGGPATPTATARPTLRADPFYDDRVVKFRDLADMAAKSEAVLVVEATNNVKVSYLAPDTPTTLTELKVLDVIHGQMSAPSVKLRQIGSATVHVIEAPEVLVVPGRRYIIAVVPYRWDPGRDATPTGEYSVAGTPAGVWALEGTQVIRLDGGPQQLPAELSLADFTRALRG